MTLLTHFARHWEKTADCIVWTGAHVGEDCPVVWYKGQTLSVRKLLWEEKHGVAAKGITRTCKTRFCVAHIALQGNGTLAHNELLESLKARGFTDKEIGLALSVSSRTISRWRNSSMHPQEAHIEALQRFAASVENDK